MLTVTIAFVASMMIMTYLWKPAGSAGQQRRAKVTEERGPFTARSSQQPVSRYHTIDKGGMTRCHNCACFFPMSRVVHDIVEGHLLEFCSQDCRRNFLTPRR